MFFGNRKAAAATLAGLFLVAAVYLWRARSCCGCAIPEAPSNRSLTILDASKLTGPSPFTIRYIVGAADPSSLLESHLLPAARARTLTWSIDGKIIAPGKFALPCEPVEDHVAAFRISVSDDAGATDEVILLSIPASTERKFRAWLEAERMDTGWLRALPPVYSSLLPGGTHPEPKTCSPKLWPVLRKTGNNFHPGAAYEMRSAIQPDGSGHQATYDASGKLLRDGLSAGSADRAAPRAFNIFRLIAHRDRDVLPFLWAAQLDGNRVNPKLFYSALDAPPFRQGENLEAYMRVRPAFHSTRREIPAGSCAVIQ